jgi:hypothetical protein
VIASSVVPGFAAAMVEAREHRLVAVRCAGESGPTGHVRAAEQYPARSAPASMAAGRCRRARSRSPCVASAPPAMMDG